MAVFTYGCGKFPALEKIPVLNTGHNPPIFAADPRVCWAFSYDFNWQNFPAWTNNSGETGEKDLDSDQYFWLNISNFFKSVIYTYIKTLAILQN